MPALTARHLRMKSKRKRPSPSRIRVRKRRQPKRNVLSRHRVPKSPGGLQSIFDVHEDELARLAPEDAVDLFRRLLWAEATSLKIDLSGINVPSEIDVADGGVDAEVAGVDVKGGLGMIVLGRN